MGDKKAVGKVFLWFRFFQEEDNDKAILRKFRLSARFISCVIRLILRSIHIMDYNVEIV